MGTSPEDLYNDLAASYHLIFEDWDQSIARQAAVLGPLLERITGKVRLAFWTAPAESGSRRSAWLSGGIFWLART
ncbi:MAG: hypothetical protein WA869_25590 [Alloacidobacterium sp.]